MPQQSQTVLSANEAWSALIEKYHIVEEVERNGCFHIKASQIKEYKEPRLMVNSTPFVRQYGILLTNGVLQYAKREAKQEIHRGV